MTLAEKLAEAAWRVAFFDRDPNGEECDRANWKQLVNAMRRTLRAARRGTSGISHEPQ